MENGFEVFSEPRLAPSSSNWTPTMFAEAFAETAVEAETVAPDAGEVIETVSPLELPELATPAQPLWSVAKPKTRRKSRMTHPAFCSKFPREAPITISSIFPKECALNFEAQSALHTVTSLEWRSKPRN